MFDLSIFIGRQPCRKTLVVEYPGELKANLWECIGINFVGIIIPQKVKGYLLDCEGTLGPDAVYPNRQELAIES